MHPATIERILQDFEYERALEMDLAREEREEREEHKEHKDGDEENVVPLSLEELRAHRLRYFGQSTGKCIRCNALTKRGLPCKRYATAKNGRCGHHR